MNPFDLRGPEFLLFYAVFSLLVIIAVRRFVRNAEPESAEAVRLTDPYLIAYLRGGPAEAVRVAVISLSDRNCIAIEGDQLSLSTNQFTASLSHPLEKGMVAALKFPTRLANLNASVREVLQSYHSQLVRDGLIASPGLKALRRFVWLGGAALLLGVAGLKIAIALSRGRTNIGFLVGLAILSLIPLAVAAFPRNTRRGRRTLAECRHLFFGLRNSAQNWQPGMATGDLVMMAAVFGATSVPVAAFPYRNRLFGQPSSSSSSGSDGGSSCGSSDSGGSSCGGGGGCGGCGGGGE